MDLDQIRSYCLALPDVTEDLPFGPDVLAFRVNGRIFALVDIEKMDYINLKCDPDRAISLREEYEGITPGYHMNKMHWNSVSLRSGLKTQLINELISHSYELIAAGKKKKKN